MTQEVQCQSWKQEAGPKSDPKQQTMTDKHISAPSARRYLVESFTLNSVDRVVRRGGQGRRPNPRYSRRNRDALAVVQDVVKQSGGKVNRIDLGALSQYLSRYTAAVNLVLERLYADPKRIDALGKKLSEYRGMGNALLRAERDICYEGNPEIRDLVYGRLHRNVLEQCARLIQSDWMRRQLIVTAVSMLASSQKDQLLLLRHKRVPTEMICRLRDGCAAVKKRDTGYHHALGVLRQLRTALDQAVLAGLGQQMGTRFSQRLRMRIVLRKTSAETDDAKRLIAEKVDQWNSEGFPFTLPLIRGQSVDFSASTEGIPGQGYWFECDGEHEDEIVLYIKLPPGIDGSPNVESPFKEKAVAFRFLDWLPKAASEDLAKAKRADEEGKPGRAKRLQFRASMFTDMHQQLMNTVQFQKKLYELRLLEGRKHYDLDEASLLENEVRQLKASRRSAPPHIVVRGKRVTLGVPFLGPDKALIEKALGEREYTRKAGADRGIRIPVALSVQREEGFVDLVPSVGMLLKRRAVLRHHASTLTSEVELRRNNWERKRPGLPYPGHLLKRIRHMEALWVKVCRLDREIAVTIASQTVWFCEEHAVKKVFFEDLRDFQPSSGLDTLSWSLSMNLWGRIIDSVRYMREALGHSKYSVWTVNPRNTSQVCHVCGERGIRVEDSESTVEVRGGRYLYCPHCNTHHDADINAARNIIQVQSKSSVASGRRTSQKVHPTDNKRPVAQVDGTEDVGVSTVQTRLEVEPESSVVPGRTCSSRAHPTDNERLVTQSGDGESPDVSVAQSTLHDESMSSVASGREVLIEIHPTDNRRRMAQPDDSGDVDASVPSETVQVQSRSSAASGRTASTRGSPTDNKRPVTQLDNDEHTDVTSP